MKKSLLLLFSFIAGGAGLYLFINRPSQQVLAQETTNLAPQLMQLEVSPNQKAKDYYSQWLADEEASLWHDLETKCSITKKVIQDHLKNDYPMYLESEAPLVASLPQGKPLSQKTISCIHTILKLYKIDPATITLAPCKPDEFTTAMALEKYILVNEELFSALSSEGQQFVIAHEVAHIINHDPYICRLIPQLGKQLGINEKDLDDIYNRYSYFIELRADITAALKGYTQGMIDYLELGQKLFGEGKEPSPDYPTISVRLAHAQKIQNLQTV